jgi:dienelactone hydrolase
VRLIASLLLLSWTAAPPDRAADARRFVDLLASGDFGAAVAMYDDTMKAALPAPSLREAWGAVGAQAGPFRKQESTRVEQVGAHQAVVVTTRFEKMTLDVKVVFDEAGRVAGLFFAPAAAVPPPLAGAPAYCRAGAFTEREVTVGTGEWALPGTLTVPGSRGPHPALALVHGSGSHDRDETIGPNKPFADLACGLATRGVAVLRYEKRTRQHGARLMAAGPFTVKEETVDDALAAAALLRDTAGIDPQRVFVLGHSLGGMLVPRIARADPALAGLVVLAGNTRPMEDLILEQLAHLGARGGASEAEKKALEGIRADVARVKALRPEQAGSVEKVMGVPASYWVDVIGYRPAQAARELAQPLLILQGERDYQVTMADFEGWKEALRGRPKVTFKSYKDLNHLFMAGSGPSTPADYQRPGHVAEPLVEDIAEWILSQQGGAAARPLEPPPPRRE